MVQTDVTQLADTLRSIVGPEFVRTDDESRRAYGVDALERGAIAGAAIDVFETEPLPSDSPLWHAPNTILTPHVGGYADIYDKQCFPTVLENFRAYAERGPGALKGAVRS